MPEDRLAPRQLGIVLNNGKEEAVFEDLLEKIGSRGKFQKRFNAVFNCAGACLNGLATFVFVLAVQTPEHWCHVPGRERTNLSMEEWKSNTIPPEGDSYSQCLMYVTESDNESSARRVVPCRHGWDYDNTWFESTLPSQMNWVCDDKILLSNAMFFGQTLSLLLSFCFGYLGDRFGRRLQYFLSTAAQVIGRVTKVFTPSLYVLFIAADGVAISSTGSSSESSLAVGVELTDIDHRSTVNFYSSTCYLMGITLSSVLPWMMPNWNYFCLASSVPMAVMFLFYRWFPESPRWLIARGRYDEALSTVRHIASTNGRETAPDLSETLQSMARRRDHNVGVYSIFSSWNLFKNTLLLIFGRSAIFLTGMCLMLNVGNLSVNPFLAMLGQNLAMMAGYLVGHLSSNRCGRRWTGVGANLMVASSGAVIMVMISVSAPWSAITAASMLMQTFTQMSYIVLNLQSVEVHPTRLRQIAAALEWSACSLVLSASSYIVFVGGSLDRRLPFAILVALNLLASVLVSFLPESSQQRLPETLEDAAKFGTGQRYWSWNREKSTQQF